MSNDVETKLAPFVAEVLQLRSSVSIPHSSAIPQAVLDSLLDARAKADRAEALSIEVLRFKYRVGRQVEFLKASVDDSWSQAISEIKKAGSRSGDQYEGPRERYAQADLAVLTIKRDLRKAEEFLSFVDEASDVIKTALRGLNEVIQDHRIWLRTIQVQSYIEK